jgi:hypothetical protein
MAPHTFYYMEVPSFCLDMAIVILPFLDNPHDCLTRYGPKCEGDYERNIWLTFFPVLILVVECPTQILD